MQTKEMLAFLLVRIGVNIINLLDKESLKLRPIKNLKRKYYGEDNQIEILGFLEGVNPPQVAVICHACKNDSELYKDGLFRTLRNRLNAGSYPCGCGLKSQWEEWQYKVLCQRKAEELDFQFHGWAGDFVNQHTKLKLSCNIHNSYWEKTSLVHFIMDGGGCQLCRYEAISSKISVEDQEIINRFLSTDSFAEGTLFSRENYDIKSRKWDVYCPVCEDTLTANSSNLSKGSRPCGCGRHSQTKAYIHLIQANNETIAVKFGVSVNPRRRFNEQKAASCYDVICHSIWQFSSVSSCKRAEQMCKQLSDSYALSKSDFPNGYTETVFTHMLEDVVRIYLENGGKRLFI